MPTVLILYNTKTGNTEKMAQAVEQGVQTVPDVQVTLAYHATPDDLQKTDAVIVGTPTYNHQMTMDIQALLEKAAQAEITLNEKVVAAFGSYGWSGEAPIQVLEILKNKFQARVIEPPVLANYRPGTVILEQCRELGRQVAQILMQNP